MGLCRALVHHAETGFNDSIEFDSISRLIPDARNVLWIDVQDPTEGDLEMLRREFGFHELALEDVARRHQRAKIEKYEGYYFLVFYAMRPGECQEISLFIGENYLVTIHTGEVPEIAETVARWRRNADRMAHGVGLPVYSVLDALVDGYFPVLDQVAERVDAAEDAIFESPDQEHIPEVFKLRKELLRLRRILAPEREVLNTLLRREEPILGEHTLLYFQDVYDHVIRILDSVDLYRDQVTGLLDAHLAVVSNRLNFVMKRMTALATILVSMTVVSGIYGMNFTNMPELQWEYGYYFALALIALVAIVLFSVFKRIDWL